MKLRPASIDATDDDGRRIGGPWALPLADEARKEITKLAREFGPINKEQPK